MKFINIAFKKKKRIIKLQTPGCYKLQILHLNQPWHDLENKLGLRLF